MILGIGNDIIEVERIEAAIKRYEKRFLSRIFTSQEQKYCLGRKQAALHFAGRFAAKEAVVKALGIGFSQGISWLDVEILPDSNGKPTVFFSNVLRLRLNSTIVHVSISHCRAYATACAIWERL